MENYERKRMRRNRTKGRKNIARRMETEDKEEEKDRMRGIMEYQVILGCKTGKKRENDRKIDFKQMENDEREREGMENGD